MEKDIIKNHLQPYIWNDWYLTIKNIESGSKISVIVGDTCYDCFTRFKKKWNIYLTRQSINNKVNITSRIIKYLPDENIIYTRSGSEYKLGVPLNGVQKYFLRKYFEGK